MAKKKRQNVSEAGGSTPAAGQSAVIEFAEDLGRLLGTAQAKADGWMNQRKAVADQLAQIRDTANRYIQQLTGGSAAAAPAKRGRPAGSKSTGAAKRQGKKRTLSPEARERIAAAQRARWAKQKGAKSAR